MARPGTTSTPPLRLHNANATSSHDNTANTTRKARRPTSHEQGTPRARHITTPEMADTPRVGHDKPPQASTEIPQRHGNTPSKHDSTPRASHQYGSTTPRKHATSKPGPAQDRPRTRFRVNTPQRLQNATIMTMIGSHEQLKSDQKEGTSQAEYDRLPRASQKSHYKARQTTTRARYEQGKARARHDMPLRARGSSWHDTPPIWLHNATTQHEMTPQASNDMPHAKLATSNARLEQGTPRHEEGTTSHHSHELRLHNATTRHH